MKELANPAEYKTPEQEQEILRFHMEKNGEDLPPAFYDQYRKSLERAEISGVDQKVFLERGKQMLAKRIAEIFTRKEVTLTDTRLEELVKDVFLSLELEYIGKKDVIDTETALKQKEREKNSVDKEGAHSDSNLSIN